MVIFLHPYIPLDDLCNFLFIYIPFLDFVGRCYLRFNAYVPFLLGGQLGAYPDSAVANWYWLNHWWVGHTGGALKHSILFKVYLSPKSEVWQSC